MDKLKLAKTLFNYLYITDLEEETIFESLDFIMGFGHFDLDIPHQCLHLYQQNPGSKVIFTGGIGAGTADLGKPEADAFLEYSKTRMAIDKEDFMVENQSTNTAENMQFSLELLKQSLPNFDIDRSMDVALVANPYRQRRVLLTFQKHWPGAQPFNAPPESSFGHEIKKFEKKGFNLIDLMLGEIDRIIDYGKKGWIEKTDVPVEVLDNYKQLKS